MKSHLGHTLCLAISITLGINASEDNTQEALDHNLQLAVFQSKPGNVRSLLSKGANPFRVIAGKPLIAWAREKKVQRLIDEVTLQAIARKNASGLRTLLESRYQKADNSIDGIPLAHWVTALGSLECLKVLEQNGSNFREKLTIQSDQPMSTMEAGFTGFQEGIEGLIVFINEVKNAYS